MVECSFTNKVVVGLNPVADKRLLYFYDYAIIQAS